MTARSTALAGARPSSVPELITALAALEGMPPGERAAVLVSLADAAQAVLARERRRAMYEATRGPDGTSARYGAVAELAGVLGIHRSKVDDAIAEHKKYLRETGNTLSPLDTPPPKG